MMLHEEYSANILQQKTAVPMSSKFSMILQVNGATDDQVIF